VGTFGGSGTLRSDGLWALRIDVDERTSTRTDIETCEFGPNDAAPAEPFGPGCGDPERVVDRVRWEVEGTAFSLAFFPEYAPSWASYAAGSLSAGQVPYIPGAPFQAPWSGKYGFLWTLHRAAPAGRWLLGGNIQIYGDPSSSASMAGLWLDYGGALPAPPADPPGPIGPPSLPTPPAAATLPAPPAVAGAKRRSARKPKAKTCRKAKARRGKKARRRTTCAKKKRAAKKRTARRRARR
jgi:hypothetical protein